MPKKNKAHLVYRERHVYNDGAIREMTLWKLPVTDRERPHGYKYSLFYGKPGQRLVGYDNERRKGDHRHYGNREVSYTFETVEKLVADFMRDVAKLRGDDYG